MIKLGDIKLGDKFELGYNVYEITSISQKCDVVEIDCDNGDEIKIFLDTHDYEKSLTCKHFYDGYEMQPCDLNIYEMRMVIEIVDELREANDT